MRALSCRSAGRCQQHIAIITKRIAGIRERRTPTPKLTQAVPTGNTGTRPSSKPVASFRCERIRLRGRVAKRMLASHPQPAKTRGQPPPPKTGLRSLRGASWMARGPSAHGCKRPVVRFVRPDNARHKCRQVREDVPELCHPQYVYQRRKA